jgi:LEA14-like dessication related protein
MKNKALLIGAALAVGYFIYTAKEFAQNVKVRLTGIKFNDNKSKQNFYTQIWFDIGLQVSNPSSFETTLESINLDIYFNRRKVGTVEKFGATRLAPQSENNILIPAVVPVFSLFSTISEAVKIIKATLKREGQPISLGVKGLIKTSSGSIQIDTTQTVSPL